MIITVYDASQVKRCYDDSGNFTGADPGLFQVVASFTLDLTTQTADPNWDYLDEGYQQLHLDTYPADSGNFLGGFTNGFYVGKLPGWSPASPPAARPGTNSPASW